MADIQPFWTLSTGILLKDRSQRCDRKFPGLGINKGGDEGRVCTGNLNQTDQISSSEEISRWPNTAWVFCLWRLRFEYKSRTPTSFSNNSDTGALKNSKTSLSGRHATSSTWMRVWSDRDLTQTGLPRESALEPQHV